MDGNGDPRQGVNVSQWIANAIADTGCTVVYGGHGGALVPLVDAVCEHPGLAWVCARNEHDAATMASAHAKLTGGLGCVIATSGPGATNLATGLMEAVLDQSPLLAITGMKPTGCIGYSEFQDVNQSRLFAGAGVEFSKDVASNHAAIPLLRDAVAHALSRRTCAHLAVPVDIQAAPSPLPLKAFCAAHASIGIRNHVVHESEIDACANALVGKPDERKPRNVIAVGHRACVETTDGNGRAMSDAILDLAEALDAPVVTRLHAKGVVDETHPLAFGVIGVHGKPGLETAADLISTSDRIVAIGVEDETLLLCNTAGFQVRKLVEIQPDAVAVSTRYSAEVTLLGDMEQICRRLTALVEGKSARVEKKRQIESILKEPTNALHTQAASILQRADYSMFNSPMRQHMRRESSTGDQYYTTMQDILPRIKELGEEGFEKHADALWKAMHKGHWKALMNYSEQTRSVQHEPIEGYAHPATVLHTLSKLRVDDSVDDVAKKAVIAVDVGDVTLWASLCLTLRAGSKTLYSERLGTMGYALNAAIPVVLAHPGPSAAVVLAGDGGFQMTLQELATFQQMKRPGDKLLCIVFDNNLLGRVTFGFGGAKGCEIKGPDYVALAKAYGGDGVRLDDESKTEEVLRQAMATEGLFLIHVIVHPDVKADMATFNDKALQVMSSG